MKHCWLATWPAVVGYACMRLGRDCEHGYASARRGRARRGSRTLTVQRGLLLFPMMLRISRPRTMRRATEL